MIGCIALRLVFVYRVAEAQEKFPYTVGKLCWSKSIEADGRIEWEEHVSNRFIRFDEDL